jgi:lipoprotein-releasing system permease protein
MIGVAVGTMALVIVLSVFNGLENLIRSLYNTFDAEVKISLAKGKSFELTDEMLRKINGVEGVDIITEVIEDNALLKYKEDQMVVKLKGVSENFVKQRRMDSMMVDGSLALHKKEKELAIIGRGIQNIMSISLNDNFFELQLWYPKNKASVITDPTKVFNREAIKPGGVFAIEKQYDDNYIFVPIAFTERLFNYGNRRTSIEIKAKNGYAVGNLEEDLQKALGPKFLIQNSDEQHAGLLKAIKIEKLFVYITFSFILAIASFNIFFSLTMLAIDKKKDVAILFSLGATKNFIKKLFLLEGSLIAFSGAFTGLFLGFLLCYLQQELGIVSMGMETSVVDAYPVKMQVSDFVITGFTILIITMIASYRPAIRASKINVKDNLY